MRIWGARCHILGDADDKPRFGCHGRLPQPNHVAVCNDSIYIIIIIMIFIII